MQLTEQNGLFDQLHALQGQSLTLEDAVLIDEQQRQFMTDALTEGFELWHMFSDPDQKCLIGKNLQRIFHQFESLARAVMNPYEDTNYLLKMANELRALLEEVHEDQNVTPQQKLFLKFLIGLLRFDLAVQLGAVHNAHLFEDGAALLRLTHRKSSGDFLNDLHEVDDIAFETGDRIAQVYGEKVQEFWQKSDAILNENLRIRQVAQILASLQHLPSNTDLVTMAQCLHWLGFGGNGEFLRQFPEIAFLSRQAINYNGEGQEGHFNQRMKMFADILMPLRERTWRNLAELIKKQFPDQREIAVFDDGAGPMAALSRGLAKYLPDKELKVTAADVSGASLKKLLEQKRDGTGVPNFSIADVRCRDISRPDTNTNMRNSAKVYFFGNVLHQLMDGLNGDEILMDAFSHAVEAVEPGGLIVVQDVGAAGYLQFPIIPANLTDVEGHVPRNIYDRIKFNDVAVPLNGTGKVKIAYPLAQLADASPVGLKDGNGIYETNIFIVVEISSDDLRLMDEDRSRASEIVQTYLDVGKLQNEVKGATTFSTFAH